MWFFVFSINFARTREGRPAPRKLTELLVKSKKTLVTEPAAIFFVFQVNISCKTTSIILYFKYASFSVVTRKKRQNTNPHPDGNFFDDRFGLGILRDEKLVTYKRLVFQTCSPNPLTDCCLVSFQLRKPKMPFELRRVMANVTSLDSFVRAMSIETTFMTSLKEVVRRLNSGEKSMHKTNHLLVLM